MPESHQDKGPEEGSTSLDRQDMAEKPAGFRAAHPPTQTDVQIVKDDALGARPEAADSADVEASEEAGGDADAVVSPPSEAKPGEKHDPDMKDMAVGPRPTDDQSAQ